MIERWTAGQPGVAIEDQASLSLVREQVRARAQAAGLDPAVGEGLVTAASELASNVLRHAREGRVVVRPVRRGGVPGVEVVAADRGPGIADPPAALSGRGSGAFPRLTTGTGPTGTGLGAGLAGARRLAQELDLDVRLGEGTCVWARSFAAPVPRSEVALFGRALAGEPVSGDDGAFWRGEEHLLLAVADGLGHGPEAREASRAAIDALASCDPGAALGGLLARCADAVRGTRGAVITLLRLGLRDREGDHLGVGDVRTVVCGPGKLEVLLGNPGLLAGSQAPTPRTRAAPIRLNPHGALAIFTDGLRSAAAPGPGAGSDPVALACELATRFARGTDDLLVLAAR